MLGKLLAAADHYAVREPATGGIYNARAGHLLLRAHFTHEEKPFPSAVSLQCCLLTKVNIVPASKRKIFKGPSSISTEHAQMVNLELQYLITDTVHRLGYSVSMCTLLHTCDFPYNKTTTEVEVAFPAPGSRSTNTFSRTYLLLTHFLRPIRRMTQGYQQENFVISFVVHISFRKFFLLTNMNLSSSKKAFLCVCVFF